MEFQKELRDLINRYSMESGSDTPDYILAEYLMGCLEVFNKTVKARESWYGRGGIGRTGGDGEAPNPRHSGA